MVCGDLSSAQTIVPPSAQDKGQIWHLGSVGMVLEQEKRTAMGLSVNAIDTQSAKAVSAQGYVCSSGVYSMLGVMKGMLFHSKALWWIF